ncbi:MAG: hypothetical protein H6766_07610 [Candidatus Peribacteria bacterium]|nr:MAG: hypothetical protein H6766_07610 [Candidatus Peribacteria bacterium]
MTLFAIIFYLLLLDALVANIIARFGEKRYVRHFRLMSRFFPITKGWTTYYLVLVLYIGYLTMR